MYKNDEKEYTRDAIKIVGEFLRVAKNANPENIFVDARTVNYKTVTVKTPRAYATMEIIYDKSKPIQKKLVFTVRYPENIEVKKKVILMDNLPARAHSLIEDKIESFLIGIGKILRRIQAIRDLNNVIAKEKVSLDSLLKSS